MLMPMHDENKTGQLLFVCWSVRRIDDDSTIYGIRCIMAAASNCQSHWHVDRNSRNTSKNQYCVLWYVKGYFVATFVELLAEIDWRCAHNEQFSINYRAAQLTLSSLNFLLWCWRSRYWISFCLFPPKEIGTVDTIGFGSCCITNCHCASACCTLYSAHDATLCNLLRQSEYQIQYD